MERIPREPDVEPATESLDGRRRRDSLVVDERIASRSERAIVYRTRCHARLHARPWFVDVIRWMDQLCVRRCVGGPILERVLRHADLRQLSLPNSALLSGYAARERQLH